MDKPSAPRAARLFYALRGIASSTAADVVGLAGGVCIVHGLRLISEPAAWIVGGIFLFLVAALLTLRERA
jgi:hypothetical protein